MPSRSGSCSRERFFRLAGSRRRPRAWVNAMTSTLGRGRLRLPAKLVLLFLTAVPVNAAEPNLRNVTVRGLQIGGTTTLTAEGDDLGTGPRLLLPFPAKQERKPGATGQRATFDVTLADDVPPGYHHLRV